MLFEIDSPGGTAIASEQLYVAVRRLAACKPVVAWIKGVGASGAYFLACAATRVLAFPSALVGSIGVISVRPVVVDALRRAGARIVVTKTGPFKDLGAPWREPTEEDEAHERELVDAIFRRFTGAVRVARGYPRLSDQTRSEHHLHRRGRFRPPQPALGVGQLRQLPTWRQAAQDSSCWWEFGVD